MNSKRQRAGFTAGRFFREAGKALLPALRFEPRKSMIPVSICVLAEGSSLTAIPSTNIGKHFTKLEHFLGLDAAQHEFKHALLEKLRTLMATADELGFCTD